MERTALSRIAAGGLLLAGMVFAGDAAAQVNAHGVRAVPVMLDPRPSTFHLAAPPEVKLQAKGLMLQQATVIVNVLGPSDLRPFGNHVDEFCDFAPVDAAAAFNYAANIWASQLQSSVPIHIDACFASLGGLILGQAGPATFFRDQTGFPTTVTWYPKALANALHGSELDSSIPDIQAEFTTDYSSWYYGTDGNPGINLDFVSVVLHELGHGLGFVGGADWSGGVGSIDSCCDFPFRYDQFTVDNAGTHLTSYVNPSAALGTTLVSNAVFFSGTNANAANGGSRVRLYAPTTWAPGSSYSHLDESFNNTPNALMTFAISPGESEHSPGPVMLGMFKDMGWQLQTASTADVGLTESATPNPAVTGKDVVFTMTVTNHGPGTATGVVVHNAYDLGASVIWASPSCGAVVPGLYDCTVGTLANGASMTFKLVLRTNNAGSTFNNAGVTSATTDSNSANNSPTLAVPVSLSPAGMPVLRYRLYSPVTQEHLYTTDLNEYNTLGSFVGTWNQEGTVGSVLNNPGSFNGVIATPYYRLYNTTTNWHHWTTDPNEYYTLILFPNWHGEGVDGFILPANTTGATELFRLLYPDGRGLHHWTIDPVEYNALITTFGWIGEGGSGFVIQ
jgi:uncharacterized repeat protein (TIGR01451 family)